MQSLSPRTFLVTFSFDARVIGMLTAQEVLLPTNYFIKTTLLKQWGMTGTGEGPPTVRILPLFTQELVMPIKILTRWNSPIRIPLWFMQIQSRSDLNYLGIREPQLFCLWRCVLKYWCGLLALDKGPAPLLCSVPTLCRHPVLALK